MRLAKVQCRLRQPLCVEPVFSAVVNFESSAHALAVWWWSSSSGVHSVDLLEGTGNASELEPGYATESIGAEVGGRGRRTLDNDLRCGGAEVVIGGLHDELWSALGGELMVTAQSLRSYAVGGNGIAQSHTGDIS